MKTTGKQLYVIILFTLLLLFIKPSNPLSAQNYQLPAENKSQLIYLGLGLSINDYGLGLGVEFPLAGKISVNGNLGIGGWGLKAGGSLNFYTTHISNGSEFSIGYSYASGMKDFNYDLWVDPFDEKQVVNMDLNSVGTINFIYTYNLRIGYSCKAGFSGGYAFPISTSPYTVNTAGANLSSDSKQLMDIMAPGGLIVGIRFMFGL